MFEKIYRVLVIILLSGVMGMQALSQLNALPSADCRAALDEAAKIVNFAESQFNGDLDDYKKAAYDKAENINQQIFISNEYTFLSQHVTGMIEQSLLRVQVACR